MTVTINKSMFTIYYDETRFDIPNRYIALDYQRTVGNGFIINAYDTETKKNVAIKKFAHPVVDPFNARRTYREFVILNLINHRNVVRLLNTYTPQNNIAEFSDVYHVTEGNLRPIILQNHQHEPLSILMYQILCGVNHLHKSGIIHRNLKPDSIGFNNHAIVKLLDFGMACPENCSRLTAYVSTRYYRAPEIILGIGYKANADVWSLGCIFVEFITKKILFAGTTNIDQWIKIIQILGTPNSVDCEYLSNSAKEYVKSLPYYPTQSWERILPDSLFVNGNPPYDINSQELKKAVLFRNLISKMLVIDPNKRICIRDALNHPYVKTCTTSENRQVQVDGPPSPSYNIAIDEMEHSIETWKNLIFRQIQAFQQAFH